MHHGITLADLQLSLRSSDTIFTDPQGKLAHRSVHIPRKTQHGLTSYLFGLLYYSDVWETEKESVYVCEG